MDKIIIIKRFLPSNFNGDLILKITSFGYLNGVYRASSFVVHFFKRLGIYEGKLRKSK